MMTEPTQGGVTAEEPAEELEECFPEVIPGITRWVWSKESRFSGGVVLVSEDGLRGLLQFVRDVQAHMIAGLMPEANAKNQQSNLAALLNRSSTVWCEGDLIVSGLFVSGEPIRNARAEESDASVAKGPGRRALPGETLPYGRVSERGADG